MRKWILGFAAVALLAGCSVDAVTDESVAVTSPAVVDLYPTPPYQLREDRDGYATAYVIDELTDDELSRVFYNAKSRIVAEGTAGGWFLSINCGSYDGPRLANGKFALDRLGAAQTGLDRPQSEFETLPSRQPCGQ